ncbi:unnamed protein product [Prunus armeniaca]|uniref:Uncharacterized protein n=1 Tax=Prunus armeniaca TaxID=36596 RepID=A0A6J5WQL4_PRUAR|nr:unnamed protein product [Prunus armeniaca]
MDLVRSRILDVGRDFWRIGLLVAISVPISQGSFVVGIWDPGGDRAFTVVEPYLAEFAKKVTEVNLESPNSP